MWWLLLLSAGDVALRDQPPVPAAPFRSDMAASVAPRLAEASFDLGTIAAAADQRLAELDDTVVPARSMHPLAVSAIDDERQRLVIGVKPGSGKNKLSVVYRLRLGQ